MAINLFEIGDRRLHPVSSDWFVMGSAALSLIAYYIVLTFFQTFLGRVAIIWYSPVVVTNRDIFGIFIIYNMITFPAFRKCKSGRAVADIIYLPVLVTWAAFIIAAIGALIF